MVATAALETSELQRGDGAWENIQDVLRSAFLALQRDSLRHAQRLSVCEQRVMDLGDNCAGKVELQRFAQQTQHVDALARAVNALSDELRDLAQREDARHEQQKQWSASLPEAIALQLRDAETRVLQRVDAIENELRASLSKLERRLALVDQELGHLAIAVDGKADVESVQQSLQTHRKLTDDALKQRCRKAAFDREVLRVHQLLRSHQTTLVEQHETLQQQLRDDLERLRSECLSPSPATLQSQLETLQSQLETLREELTRQQQTATDDVRVLLQLETAQTRGACREAMAKAMDDVQQRSATQASETSKTLEELRQQLTTLRLETSDATAKATEAATNAAASAAAAAASIDERQTLLLEQMAQTKRELEAALGDWTRTRERKLRQQLSAVAARLSEMDQVLKLAGQQLVQNTSQLQLLWSEWQRAPAPSALAMGEKSSVNAQEEENEEEEEEQQQQQQQEHKRKKSEDAAALRDLVEAKLREYDKVLEPARDAQ
ncbi:hypothetical protein PINS_up007960 [Pythium insidiosum]|nr:hypothetical protein PINS_up007960 [Pythium insidiosum]